MSKIELHELRPAVKPVVNKYVEPDQDIFDEDIVLPGTSDEFWRVVLFLVPGAACIAYAVLKELPGYTLTEPIEIDLNSLEIIPARSGYVFETPPYPGGPKLN